MAYQYPQLYPIFELPFDPVGRVFRYNAGTAGLVEFRVDDLGILGEKLTASCTTTKWIDKFGTEREAGNPYCATIWTDDIGWHFEPVEEA